MDNYNCMRHSTAHRKRLVRCSPCTCAEDNIHLIKRSKRENPGYYHSSCYSLSLVCTSQSNSLSWICTAPCLFVTHICLTMSDCFVDHAFFGNCFQLKLNGLIIPYVKENLNFTSLPTTSSRRTKLSDYLSQDAKGYIIILPASA